MIAPEMTQALNEIGTRVGVMLDALSVALAALENIYADRKRFGDDAWSVADEALARIDQFTRKLS